MKIQPRQQLLEIWRATARSSYRDGAWVWGGRDQTNSISDAEQLLCLMTPASDVPAFRLDRPDETADDILDALKAIGDSVELPKILVRVLTEYMRTYTDDDGTPIFSGGTYFNSAGFNSDASPSDDGPNARQRTLDVVDSFSMSVTLTLAAIGFLSVFRRSVKRESLLKQIDELAAMASKRLTAAMVGLLRSFTVNVFHTDSAEGRALCRTANQNGLPDRQIVEDLRRELREVNARLRDVTIGSGAAMAADLDNPNNLFECGWSWGIVKDAPLIHTPEEIGRQRDGVAQAAPYLYFTVVALEGIQALFTRRTRLLGLLSEEQLRLSQALQLRWDLTQSYWSTLATFGTGRWPLEDLPWRATDDVESDYFSLLVSAMVINGLLARRASDAELSRVGLVLDELANRNRITRRPFNTDPAIAMHSTGLRVDLLGSDEAGEARLAWAASDFSPLLLKRTVRLAGLLHEGETRGRLLALADEVWENHLAKRRLSEGDARDLWDQPRNLFPEVGEEHTLPSWYYTKRVVDCLVTAATVVGGPPIRSERLFNHATDLLNEADHLFDQELLIVTAEGGPALRELNQIRAELRRARGILRDRPGSAGALASDVLRRLDALTAARQNVNGTR